MTKRTKLRDGRFLVKFARKAIKSHFTDDTELKIPDRIRNFPDRDARVFVTLKTYQEKGQGGKKLRGCMGYVGGVMPLIRSLREAAQSAAFRDYRFHPLRRNELEHTTVEVSLAAKPEYITANNPGEYVKK